MTQIIVPQILDKNTSPQYLQANMAMDIVNMRVNELGVSTPLKGTLYVPQNLINDDYVCGSSFEDENTSTIFAFHRDAVGKNHIIERYVPSISQRQIIMKTPALNFQDGYPVVNCTPIDKFLPFSDKKNPPRFIDWQKGNRTGKRLEATVLFGKPEEGVNKIFTQDTVYTMTFVIPNIGTVNTIIWTVPSGAYEDNPIRGAVAFRKAFNANVDINAYFVATNCGCGDVKLVEINPSGDADGNITTISIDVSNAPDTQNPKALVVYDNVYPQIIDDFHINRARRVPIKAPDAVIGVDSEYTYNFIQKKSFQFSVRYIYTDKHVSSPSPISAIPIPPQDCSGNGSIAYNYIDVDITDQFQNVLAVDEGGILKKAEYLQDIEAVEILVRDSNDALWEIAKYLPRCEFGLHRQFWRFYNDIQRISLPEEQSPNKKLFDAVPYLNGAEDSATLSTGEGWRVYMANLLEGNNLICPDLRAVSHDTPNPPCSCTYTVIIDMKIYNPFFDIAGFHGGCQAVWQNENGATVFGGIYFGTVGYVHDLDKNYLSNVLPAKGFGGYLGGSKYRTLSKQVIATANNASYANTEYGVLDGADDGGRIGIRDALATQDIKQRFIFTGVHSGVYPFRLCSNMCSDDDILGKGAIYNYKNGTLYQNTSLARMGTDIIVDLPFNDTTTEEQTVYIGVDYDILDLTWVAQPLPSVFTYSLIAVGYLKDANGNNDPNVLKTGLAVEGMLHYAGTSSSPTLYPHVYDQKRTDHNGFFYAAHTINVGWVNGNEPSNQIDYYNGSAIKAFGGNLYQAGLQEFYDGTLGTIVQAMAIKQGAGIAKLCSTEYIAYTDTTIQRDEAKDVIVSVNDQYGNPVAGIPVTLTGIGRSGLTGTDGKFKALKYSSLVGQPPFIFNNDVLAMLAMGENCCINVNTPDQNPDLYSGFLTNPLATDIELPASGAFGITVNYDDIYATLKRGERYRLCIMHYDTSKRGTTAEYTQNSIIDVPFWTQSQNLNTFAIEWRIYSLPPQDSLYTHFQIGVAKYGNYAKYVQFIAAKVVYYEIYKSVTVNVISSFDAGNASEIHISTDSIATFNEQNKNSSVQYEFQEGDRLRIIKLDTGALYPSFVDLPITGYENGYVIIKNNNDLLEIKTGALIELYAESNNVAEGGLVFNEISQPYPIIEDGGVRYYGGGESFTLGGIVITAQDQSATQPYASGYFNFGDTYLHTRPYQTNVDGKLRLFQPLIESDNISDYWLSKNKSIGRINVEDRDAAQLWYQDKIRYSNPYLANTNTNGLCRFEYIDRQTFNARLAGIQYVAQLQGVLVCVGKTNTIAVYLGQSNLVTQTGEGLITLNDKILAGYRDLGGAYGTRHPLSCRKWLGNLFAFDATNKCIWQYTQGGIYERNKNAGTDTGLDLEIRRLSAQLPYEGLVGDLDNLVFSAIDKQRKEFLIRIADATAEDGFLTYVYQLDKQVWRSRYNLGGGAMSQTQAGVVSFVLGGLYEHDKTDEFNTFYGIEYPAIFDISLNEDVANVKNFQSLIIYGQYEDRTLGVFHSPNNGDVRGLHPLGLRERLSRIDEARFKPIQSAMKADFRRDILSPNCPPPAILNGEDLISKYLLVKLICNNRKMFQIEKISYLYKTNAKRNI